MDVNTMLFQKSDEWIVQRVLEGEKEMMRILVERHRPFVLTCICRTVKDRHLAEDIVQEVFVKAYRALHTYRGDAKFTTWLYRLTCNQMIDSLRKQRRGGRLEQIEYNHTELLTDGWSNEPEEYVVKQEHCEEVRRTLKQLPDKYRSVMELYHMRQQSYAEIAEKLHMPVRTVETRLYRAKMLFKNAWTQAQTLKAGIT
ncbi:RNA polymerase sigma factor [Paenibacillus sp. 481]|uniref:RNA polymerase sigma factor n=1 Tax=Paenibacillus sp. 481 TaxID=2835869 RepID=UPI001E380EE3|nr:sigma-70 family RNA polymerase sigma factor [Paenibacillus sp. 481]UHA74738.1 sigma-70 family RNA polymerase sigma factor [Paenibacillus sp. 481]